MLRLSSNPQTPNPAKLRRQSSPSDSSPPWSDLTPLALERVRDLLDSNLYDTRLRSVCRSWRASLSHPRRPNRTSDFPIRLPHLPDHIQEASTTNTPTLKCSLIYKISPKTDPSDGWLIRSPSDANPNTFALHSILTSKKITPSDIRSIRSFLDLRHYRVSEVSKSYHVDNGKPTLVRKALLLPRFVKNIEFTVLLLFYTGEMYYFNDGDSAWTAIDVKDYSFKDVILFKGLCYAADERGSLVSIDSAFRLSKVVPSPGFLLDYEGLAFINLVAFESHLFLVVVDVYTKDLHRPDQVYVFRWISDTWWSTFDLGRGAVLLSSHEASAVVCARDFAGCKDNRVYFSYPMFWKTYFDEGDKAFRGQGFDVYDLLGQEVVPYKMKPHCASLSWPPPTWMQLPSP